MERRNHPRKSLAIPAVMIGSGTKVISGIVRDLSAEGIFVETEPSEGTLYDLERLDLVFMSALHGNRTLRVNAIVMRRMEYGLGLQIDVKDAQGRSALKQLIASAVPSRALRQRAEDVLRAVPADGADGSASHCPGS